LGTGSSGDGGSVTDDGVDVEDENKFSSLEKGKGNIGDKFGGGNLLMRVGKGNENGNMRDLL